MVGIINVDGLFSVSCIILGHEVGSVISQHHVGFSNHLWVDGLFPIEILFVVHLIIGRSEVSERIASEVNMRLFLIDGFWPIDAFLDEIVLVVGLVASWIVPEDKVFTRMTLLKFGGIVPCGEGVFREPFLELRLIVGVAVGIIDTEVIGTSIAGGFFHLSFVLFISLNIFGLGSAVI